jgi:GNAT superfamily N-acetyltransferase
MRQHLAQTEVIAAGGGWLRTRPLDREDREGLAALFERMSPTSRYRRYCSPKPRLSAGELAYLTDVDHVRHEAIAGIDRRDGAIVGVARYVAEPSRAGGAELAVEVADEFQNRGIGSALSEIIVERARQNGFRLLTATTLWENGPARSLLRRLEFRTFRSRGREIELQRVLP